MQTPIKENATRCACLALIAALGGTAASAQTSVAYTTLAPDGTYGEDGGIWEIEGADGPPGSSGYFSGSNSFIPLISGNLSSISLGLASHLAFGDDNVDISLLANNPSGGPLLSDVLASGTLAALSGVSDTALTTFTYIGPAITLFTDTTYWVLLTPGDAYSNVIWVASDLDITTGQYVSTDGGNTYYGADSENGGFAMQVNVASVPESSTWTMLIVAGLLIRVTMLRRRGNRE